MFRLNYLFIKSQLRVRLGTYLIPMRWSEFTISQQVFYACIITRLKKNYFQKPKMYSISLLKIGPCNSKVGYKKFYDTYLYDTESYLTV